jgi:GT2 family glycosyltransferase
MNPNKYAITFACYNSVAYTKLCVESMVKHGLDLSRLVVVDNDSTDDTRNYLETLPIGGKILNKSNLGCGVAWNQGALALQSEWTIVMNNDVIVSKDWIENLIQTAERNNLKIISPGMVEGRDLDYDFDRFADEASLKMKDVLRIGSRHAVCFAVHQSVWAEVGYFRATPNLLGFEDTIFFKQVDRAGIRTAITGASWLHHYGSITQSEMKRERGLKEKDDLVGRGHNRAKLLEQSWLERKIARAQLKRQVKAWRNAEVNQYGMSLLSVRENGEFIWR